MSTKEQKIADLKKKVQDNKDMCQAGKNLVLSIITDFLIIAGVKEEVKPFKVGQVVKSESGMLQLIHKEDENVILQNSSLAGWNARYGTLSLKKFEELRYSQGYAVAYETFDAFIEKNPGYPMDKLVKHLLKIIN